MRHFISIIFMVFASFSGWVAIHPSMIHRNQGFGVVFFYCFATMCLWFSIASLNDIKN
jgi:hypothetical protein